MWVGNWPYFVLVAINLIWAALNLYLFLDNLKTSKAAQIFYDDAIARRQKALDDIAEIRSNEYSVCKSCGKIIQGICISCLENPPVLSN